MKDTAALDRLTRQVNDLRRELEHVKRREITSYPIANVTSFGAVGDGTTDNTAAFAAAIAALGSSGGVIYVPAGTWRGYWDIPSNVTVCGAGRNVTILMPPVGATRAVVQTKDLAVYAATPDTRENRTFLATAPFCWVLEKLTIDGEKANQTTAVHGMDVYGYTYSLNDISVRNCKGWGIRTAFSRNSNPAANSDSMESRWNGVIIRDNYDGGVYMNGPHDSFFVNCGNFQNGEFVYGDEGPYADSHLVPAWYMAAGSTGAKFSNCHTYGLAHSMCWYVGSSFNNLTGCIGEGAQDAQVVIARNNCMVIGGVFGVFQSDSSLVRDEPYNDPYAHPIYGINADDVPVSDWPWRRGIQLGTETSNGISGCVIQTNLMNCRDGSIYFRRDGGNNLIDVLAYSNRDNGVMYRGFIADDTQINIRIGDLMNPDDLDEDGNMRPLLGLTRIPHPTVFFGEDVTVQSRLATAFTVRDIDDYRYQYPSQAHVFSVSNNRETVEGQFEDDGITPYVERGAVDLPNSTKLRLWKDEYATQMGAWNGDTGRMRVYGESDEHVIFAQSEGGLRIIVLKTSSPAGAVADPFPSALNLLNGTQLKLYSDDAYGINMGTWDGTTGNMSVKGVLTAAGKVEINHHLVTGGTTPAAVAGTGSGTGPTVALSGTDVAGKITVTTGTTPAAAGAVVTVTYGVAYSAAPRVILTPANAAAAALSGTQQVYPDDGTSDATAWKLRAGSAALAASTQYKWNYLVIG